MNFSAPKESKILSLLYFRYVKRREKPVLPDAAFLNKKMFSVNKIFG